MSTVHHYPKPPIVEAVIDIRVEQRPDLKIKDLKKVAHAERMTYPNHEDVFHVSGEFKVQAGVSASASAKQDRIGFKFTSTDRRQIFQARSNGFTFSRLAPYEQWKSLRDEARRLWTVYRDEFPPRKLTRLAVRYINRIEIPAEKIELKDYFRTSPEVSPDLPQILDGFFMQLRLPQEDLRAVALINQTIVEPTRPEHVSVILDIDVFRPIEVSQEEPEVWSFFEELHNRKNVLFEACITDKTRELFQ